MLTILLKEVIIMNTNNSFTSAGIDRFPPRIGVGVLIWNADKILLGLRIGDHGKNTWSPPGGYLEFGETFEECARREVYEEVGIVINDIQFYGVTNNIFFDENKHTVSIFMKSVFPHDQIININEPDRIEKWDWFNLDVLPDNLFLPLSNLLKGRY